MQNLWNIPPKYNSYVAYSSSFNSFCPLKTRRTTTNILYGNQILTVVTSFLAEKKKKNAGRDGARLCFPLCGFQAPEFHTYGSQCCLSPEKERKNSSRSEFGLIWSRQLDPLTYLWLSRRCPPLDFNNTHAAGSGGVMVCALETQLMLHNRNPIPSHHSATPPPQNKKNPTGPEEACREDILWNRFNKAYI